jgi:hypothetical protein
MYVKVKGMKLLFFILLLFLGFSRVKKASSKDGKFYIYLNEENCVSTSSYSDGRIETYFSRQLVGKCLATKAKMKCDYKDKISGSVESINVFSLTHIGEGMYSAVSNNGHGIYKLSFKDATFSLHLRGVVGDDQRLVTQICTGYIL